MSRAQRQRLATAAVPVVALLSTLVLAGCDDDAEPVAPAASTPTFVGSDPGDGPAVYLRAGAARPDGLSLAVVGRALPSVYGLAFRLESAPGVLVLSGFTPSASWSPTAPAVAREPVSGLVVVGLSARGAAVGFAADDDVLGTLDFQIGAATPTPVGFVDGENAVAQAAGDELGGVSWIGGAIELR